MFDVYFFFFFKISIFVQILREKRILSDDEIPSIKIVKNERKEEKEANDDNDVDEDEDEDLQQYLKRKEARQYAKMIILSL